MTLLLLLLFLALPARAGSADQPWRTVSTAHFDIHYPATSEAWALDLAGRIDEMRARVAAVVGWSPDRRTAVILMDPWGRANGFAMPYRRTPLMGVFPTAAGPASGIGNYRLWAEDLVVHEDAHLVHMGRPSRSPLGRLVFDQLLGFPPIAARAPGWVIEGYATLVEGQLTGAGRPHSDGRAAFLRALAREGQLPTYGQLDGSSRWRGGAMRYLVGSAFLEWLSERAGPDALPALWARMTARELRSFEAAFEGVFGAPPATLYGRFVAERTAGALAVEPTADAAERWVDLDGSVGPPAVSPDGQWLALVERGEGPAALVIRETAIDTEAEAVRDQRIAEQLARDPQDVAPVPPTAPPHVEAARRVHAGRSARYPRWIDDGTLLFSAWTPDARGQLRPDLYTWTVATRATRRLTRGQNVREADPCGDLAVGVRRDAAGSALVRVDLTTGAVTPLTPPSPARIEAGPRLTPDCATVAFLRNDGRWRLILRELDGGAERELPLPPGAQALSLDLAPDGSRLVASLGIGGFIDLWERPLTDGAWTRMTARPGGAFAPEVTGDATYFLGQDPWGMDVFRLDADAPRAAPLLAGPLRDPSWAAAVTRPPPAVDAPALPTGAAPPPRPYNLGRHHPRLLAGARTGLGPSPSDSAELGLFLGDLVGRSELLLQAGVTPGLRPGARADWALRRAPAHLRLHAWALHQAGGGLDVAHSRTWTGGGLSAWAGGYAEAPWGGAPRLAAAGSARARASVWTGRTAWTASLGAHGEASRAAAGWAWADARVGQPAWRLGATGWWGGARGGVVQVGGQQPGLAPDLRTATALWRPGLTIQGAPRLSLARLELRSLDDAVGLFADRLSTPAATLRAGLDVAVGTPAQPIAKIPGLRGTAGVACTLQAADAWAPRPCRDLDDWALWVGWRLQPGQPTAYP